MSIKVTVNITSEMLKDMPTTINTALTNLGDLMTIEMKKLAPFANPAQYPSGYKGSPGALMRSIKRQGEGRDAMIVAGVPYAVRRNFENRLNPQTLHYVERAIENTLAGDTSRWWRAN